MLASKTKERSTSQLSPSASVSFAPLVMDELNMQLTDYAHQPVLLNETIQHLITQANGIYIDGTFGRGGHSAAILKQLNADGRLIAIDQDLAAVNFGKEKFKADPRFSIHHSSFADLENLINSLQLTGKISGILLDLGVSSPQLDQAERGFSFMRDGTLDMRMNTSVGITAAEWLATVDEASLAQVLKEYGEERHAKRIARILIQERDLKPIITTKELAEIIVKANPVPAWRLGKHPATKSFQAIRIFINQELMALTKVLLQALSVLAIGGRLAVISFHSLEDRIVKQFLQKEVQGDSYPRGFPITVGMLNPRVKRVAPAIKPSVEETQQNPRSRSAILRTMEKII